ncbi:MAG TPA: DegT/DnrJ/EryC1/StrS family aminotransferase [Asticcacaulis sp.]|nr:DegT/DnrJ/EryC1/StrS family aminotransferase [Asticcacaulis sp.]
MSLDAYLVRTTDSLMLAAEKALDNGLGCLVALNADDVYAGHVTLEAIRERIRDGAYTRLGDISSIVAPGPCCQEGENVPAASLLTAVLDKAGKLADVKVTQNAGFIPVAEPYLSRNEFRNLMDAYLSTWISSTGEYIRGFEQKFASACGVKQGVATSNGTVSLHLALLALGIGPGDEVIVPDLTFAASINTILYCGATPVIIDVDRDTWCMSAEAFEAAITPQTRAVMPVHVFGRPAPMTAIAEIAKAHRIYVIEDCAEAHGAKYDGKPVGAFSDISSFSFFANKILTTGEGGICLTDSPVLAERMRVLRDHGMRPERRYWHEEVGYNYRMTNLQASIGCAQVDRFDELLGERHKVNDAYRAALGGIPGVVWPAEMESRATPVTWFACALVPADKRAALIAECKRKNIDLRPFFNGLSIMPAYKRWARPCPNSEYLSQSGVNLPTSHRIDKHIVSQIEAAFRAVLA